MVLCWTVYLYKTFVRFKYIFVSGNVTINTDEVGRNKNAKIKEFEDDKDKFCQENPESEK